MLVPLLLLLLLLLLSDAGGAAPRRTVASSTIPTTVLLCTALERGALLCMLLTPCYSPGRCEHLASLGCAWLLQLPQITYLRLQSLRGAVALHFISLPCCKHGVLCN
jgi:hypothetical protein